jgi:hypothetical protein
MTKILFTLIIVGSAVGCSSQRDDPRARRLAASDPAVLFSDFPLKANDPKSKAVICTLVGHPGFNGQGAYILPIGTRVEVISDDKKTKMAKHTYFDEKDTLVEIGESHDMRNVRVLLMDGKESGRACDIERYYLVPVDKK